MKIAVAGKGGTGKTTVCGTLARFLARAGYRVLAVDMDPNTTLASAIGVDKREEEIIPLTKNVELIKERTGLKPGDSFGKIFKWNPKVDDIAEKFGVPGRDNTTLLVVGTINTGGRGCFCPENALVRRLVEHLVFEGDELLLLDTEAGLEHLGRATAQGFDYLLVMVEPGMRSAQTALKIVRLAQEIGVKNHAAIVNKSRGSDDLKQLQKILRDKMEIIAEIPWDPRFIEADLEGQPPIDFCPESPGVKALEKLSQKIKDKLKAEKSNT